METKKTDIMEEKYSVGDFGYWEFEIRYKNKYGNQLRGYSGHFEVIEQDARNILLADPDMQVLVTKKRIKLFERKDKP